MKLSIMHLDNRVEEFAICRLFTIETPDIGTCLYYETPSHQKGNGDIIPLSKIKNWEVNAIIPGGNLTL